MTLFSLSLGPFRTLTRAAFITSMALSAAIVSTATTAAQAQVAGAEAQAQLRFGRGREMITANNFAGALAEFRAANALVASPNTRLYIARCLQGMGRLSEALLEFQRAAAEAADRAQSEPRYAATRDNARQEMEQIRPRVGTLTIHVPNPPPGIEVFVGDTAVTAGGFDLPVPSDPGSHVIRATAPGMREFSSSVTITAQRTSEVTVTLERDPNAVTNAQSNSNTNANSSGTNNSSTNGNSSNNSNNSTPPPPQTRRVVEGGAVRIVGIVVSGIGLAGIGTFIVFGNLAQNRYNDLRTFCGNAPCDPALGSQIDEGASYQTYANIGFGVGLTAIAAGVTMMIAGGPTEREVPVASVAITEHSAALTFSGRF